MQPHRYSRLKMLFADFTTSFNDADSVFVTEIYSAGENKLEGINRDTLIASLIAGGHKDARDFESLDKLKEFVIDTLYDGDVVIFMGAGDITQYARKFANLLQEKMKEIMYNMGKKIIKNTIPSVSGTIKKDFNLSTLTWFKVGGKSRSFLFLKIKKIL